MGRSPYKVDRCSKVVSTRWIIEAQNGSLWWHLEDTSIILERNFADNLGYLIDGWVPNKED